MKLLRHAKNIVFPGVAAAAAAAASSFITAAPSFDENDTSIEPVYDVAVVGGGVVGLAIARECAVRNYRVALFEKEDCFAAQASSGNSGLGCTGYDSPQGSLERKLLRRSIRPTRTYIDPLDYRTSMSKSVDLSLLRGRRSSWSNSKSC